MEITAKFNSICPVCGTSINVGDKCEWEKGRKARHIECPKISDDLRLQYQLSNGSWVDCENRTDEFLNYCIKNKQMLPNNQWGQMTRDDVITALKSGKTLRNAPEDWYSKCRCGNAHDRLIRKRRSNQTFETDVKKTGQLWEPCPRCGREPVYMPLGLCDHCWPAGSIEHKIDTSCREPYRRGIGQGFGPGEDGDY